MDQNKVNFELIIEGMREQELLSVADFQCAEVEKLDKELKRIIKFILQTFVLEQARIFMKKNYHRFFLELNIQGDETELPDFVYKFEYLNAENRIVKMGQHDLLDAVIVFKDFDTFNHNLVQAKPDAALFHVKMIDSPNFGLTYDQKGKIVDPYAD